MGALDKASHAYGNRLTQRTKVMFDEGGRAYVYLCYGIHHLFNIVTNKKGFPDALLIRALFPIIGLETMLKRRKKEKVTPQLCNGPGTVTKALGIELSHTGMRLNESSIFIEDLGIKAQKIRRAPRVGIDYAEEFRDKPWRLIMEDALPEIFPA